MSLNAIEQFPKNFIKEIKKLHPRALLSYISTWEFLRTLEKCEKHSVALRASLYTSLVFLKIPACLYNSTMHSDAFFSLLIFALKRSILRAYIVQYVK